MATDNSLSVNTSKVIAFEDLEGTMDENLDDDEKVNGCFGPPQIVHLPFPCDVNIPMEHELQAFESDWAVGDDDDANDLGDAQYTTVMTFDVESKEKPLRVARTKKTRVFKSPGGMRY